MMRIAFAAAALVVVCAAAAGAFVWRYYAGDGYAEVDWTVGADAAASLQAALDAEIEANPLLYGVALHVTAPGLSIDQSFAAGWADARTGAEMEPDHAARLASVTKTFVAVAALRLAEEGALDLDAPLSSAVSPTLVGLLAEDGYDVERIRIRDLMGHAGGMADFAGHPLYMTRVVLDDMTGGRTSWTPESQIRFAMTHADPVGAPGAQFHYSDTDYVLLADAVERASGEDLAAAVRRLGRFEELGLASTWWEQLEPAPADVDRAHQYLGRADLFDLDASYDLFGGGGLVSSMRDAARFMRAVVRGELFAEAETLELMMTPVNPSGVSYGLGLDAIRTEDGEQCWGHFGFWGAAVFHCPASDITIAYASSQANAPDNEGRASALLSALAAAQSARARAGG